MSIMLSGGAWLFGMAVHYVKRRRIGAETVLALVAVLCIAAESVLILRAPLPSIFPWSVVVIAGTATVVSFAVIADYFPPELAGRANGALNVLHFGWAFLAQSATGLILEQWPTNDGHRSVTAYQVAFGLNISLQIAALVWFALPWRQSVASWISSILFFMTASDSDAVEPVGVYENSIMLVPADDDAEW